MKKSVQILKNGELFKCFTIVQSAEIVFFESLTPMLFVPCVRNNMLCAAPFPFKYLDEIPRKDLNHGN